MRSNILARCGWSGFVILLTKYYEINLVSIIKSISLHYYLIIHLKNVKTMGLMITHEILKNLYLNKRVRLTAPMNDPHPIEVGSEGVVYNVGLDTLNVKWDNGRQLGLVLDEDKFEIINN